MLGISGGCLSVRLIRRLAGFWVASYTCLRLIYELICHNWQVPGSELICQVLSTFTFNVVSRFVMIDSYQTLVISTVDV